MQYGRVHGKRPVGRPKKRWLDNVRDHCKILGLTVEKADQLARDQARWSSVTRLFERAVCVVKAVGQVFLLWMVSEIQITLDI